jgi:hypothetical protein
MSNAQVLTLVSSDSHTVNFTVGTGKAVYSRTVNADGIFSKKGFSYQVTENGIELLDGEYVSNSVTRTMNPFKPLQSEFPINQRFEFLSKFTTMVIDGILPSAIVTGEGGLGKSHTVFDALKARNKKEEIDFVVVKGFATPKAVYATLYENNGKVIVFDDCDSVLKDPIAVNLLKGALDSYAVRTISWLSKGFIEDEYPASFEFTGQVIFISNIGSDKLDQAIRSRSITIDLSMTIQDKIERMQAILHKILPDYSMDVKEAALEFMAKHSDEAREFNLRTLMKATKVLSSYGLENTTEWQPAVKYLLVSI